MLTTVAWILGFVLGIVGLFVLICLPHNVRIWRVRRVYRSLPADALEQVLEFIEQAAARGPSVTFLRFAEEVACTDALLVQSHVGGVPYAESGDDPYTCRSAWGLPQADPKQQFREGKTS